MKRHQMRKSAFILVFEKIFTEDSVDDIIQNAEDSELFDISPECRELFEKTVYNTSAVDTYISENLVGWSISRISKVSLAILRLAVCEIFYIPDTPVSVSIDEAVELAKEFAAEQDASFVNGVLGSVAKKLDNGEYAFAVQKEK